MEIREIILDDLDRVFELLNNLYHGKLNFSRFQEIYKLKLEDENNYYIVAIKERKIVAILTAELQEKLHRDNKQLFIEDLIVDESYRSQGIGKALLQNAVDYARINNCNVVELTSYIDNEKAHKFYETNNFVKHSYKFKKYLR
ncbi:MAG: GNAT family N-acetyltransferase [Clostridia bacterium]|nr:GNAT family N-acetyltransferase [Clostridia bacterium]